MSNIQRKKWMQKATHDFSSKNEEYKIENKIHKNLEN